jgi:hypothetical protein
MGNSNRADENTSVTTLYRDRHRTGQQSENPQGDHVTPYALFLYLSVQEFVWFVNIHDLALD